MHTARFPDLLVAFLVKRGDTLANTDLGCRGKGAFAPGGVPFPIPFVVAAVVSFVPLPVPFGVVSLWLLRAVVAGE